LDGDNIEILQERRFPMKYLLDGILVSLFILFFFAFSYAEEMNTPYPPPTVGNVAQNGTTYLGRGSGPTASEMVADLLLVRPLSFAAPFIGAGLAVIATPFALATGTTTQLYDKLVNEPWDFGVCRPLGVF
jgi:hypothetical protein